jgi:hypothetical protein
MADTKVLVEPAASTWRYIPEDGSLCGHYHQKLSNFMTILVKGSEVKA